MLGVLVEVRPSRPTMRFFARRATRSGSSDAIASMSLNRRAARKSFDDRRGRLMTATGA